MLRQSILFAVLAAAHSAALAENHGLAAKAGMLGLGVEYTYNLNPRIGLRAGINGSKLGFDAAESGIDYEFDLVWESASVAVDFHPRRGPLRLTAGLLRNDNRLEAVSRTSGDVTVGGTTYTSDEIGTLYGAAGFDDTAPFLGVGWDWSRDKRLFGVSLDLGVVSQGDPIVALTADGALLSDPMFADDIEAERAELEAALGDLDVMPYASLGFVFRF